MGAIDADPTFMWGRRDWGKGNIGDREENRAEWYRIPKTWKGWGEVHATEPIVKEVASSTTDAATVSGTAVFGATGSNVSGSLPNASVAVVSHPNGNGSAAAISHPHPSHLRTPPNGLLKWFSNELLNSCKKILYIGHYRLYTHASTLPRDNPNLAHSPLPRDCSVGSFPTKWERLKSSLTWWSSSSASKSSCSSPNNSTDPPEELVDLFRAVLSSLTKAVSNLSIPIHLPWEWGICRAK